MGSGDRSGHRSRCATRIKRRPSEGALQRLPLISLQRPRRETAWKGTAAPEGAIRRLAQRDALPARCARRGRAFELHHDSALNRATLQGMCFGERGGSFSQLTKLLIKTSRHTGGHRRARSRPRRCTAAIRGPKSSLAFSQVSRCPKRRDPGSAEPSGVSVRDFTNRAAYESGVRLSSANPVTAHSRMNAAVEG